MDANTNSKDATFTEIFELQNEEGEISSYKAECRWLPAIIKKLPDDRGDLFNCILCEVQDLIKQGAGLEIWQHTFTYEDVRVIFAMAFDEEEKKFMFDADLVSYHDVLQEFYDEEGEKEATFVYPVWDSEADPVH